MKKSLLLVSDIDGTLLDSKGQLSQKNVKAIQHFMAQGHYFALSTGRTPVSAQPILDALQPNAPSIFMNGALLQEKNGTIVHATALEKEKLIEFLHQLPSLLPHCVIEIFTTHEIYLISNPENKDPFIEDNHIPVIYTTLEQVLQETWLKILICEKQVNEVEKLVQSFHLHEQFNTFFSSDTFYEIVPQNISKGATLRFLANQLNCPCIAIGDFDNDIEMIQEADFGVAVANAPQHVQNKADFISCDHDHDALAYLIQAIQEEKICQTL